MSLCSQARGNSWSTFMCDTRMHLVAKATWYGVSELDYIIGIFGSKMGEGEKEGRKKRGKCGMKVKVHNSSIFKTL